MKSTLFTLAMVFALSGCKQLTEQTSDISINNQYRISIPASLNKMDDLNEEASLQYGNGLQEFYIIVIDETKQSWKEAVDQYGAIIDSTLTNSFESYRNYLMGGFKENVVNSNFKNTTPITINNMNGYLYEVEGKVSGSDIYFYYTFIEGKEHFYQLMSWTMKDRKDKYKEQMVAMTNSFAEI
ncbi:MAG: hypothetical protein H7Y00_10040 [Fimbriimonadaceae bacterium]|nr:hypothetical protein [Chitinophagales bacterium]